MNSQSSRSQGRDTSTPPAPAPSRFDRDDAPKELDAETATVSLKQGRNGPYWSADHLKPGSDAWLARVHGYLPRNRELQTVQAAHFNKFTAAVGAYGYLPVGIVSSVCRNVLLTYHLSPLADWSDDAAVWNTANIHAAAAAMDAKQSTREQFTTQMLRVAYRLQPPWADRPVRYSKKRQKQAPYTSNDLDSFLRIAQAQPCIRTGWELDALVSLGAGAGTCARDLRFLRFDEITFGSDGSVDVLLRGKATVRTVPVADPWAQRLRALAAARPAARTPWVIVGTRNANLIHRLLDRADWADVSRPLLSRLRTTWTYERLLAGCRMDTVRDLLGETTFTAVGHAATFLPPVDNETEMFRTEVQR